MKKKIILAVVAALGLTAVAAGLLRPDLLGVFGLGPDRALRKRAEGYWNARMANDPKMLAPYSHPLQKPQQANTMLYTRSFEIKSVTIDGDKAKVAVHAKHTVKLPQGSSFDRELDHEDQWVRYDGEWYRALHPVGLGEMLQHSLGKWKPPSETKSGAAPAR